MQPFLNSSVHLQKLTHKSHKDIKDQLIHRNVCAHKDATVYYLSGIFRPGFLQPSFKNKDTTLENMTERTERGYGWVSSD